MDESVRPAPARSPLSGLIVSLSMVGTVVDPALSWLTFSEVLNSTPIATVASVALVAASIAVPVKIGVAKAHGARSLLLTAGWVSLGLVMACLRLFETALINLESESASAAWEAFSPLEHGFMAALMLVLYLMSGAGLMGAAKSHAASGRTRVRENLNAANLAELRLHNAEAAEVAALADVEENREEAARWALKRDLALLTVRNAEAAIKDEVRERLSIGLASPRESILRFPNHEDSRVDERTPNLIIQPPSDQERGENA